MGDVLQRVVVVTILREETPDDMADEALPDFPYGGSVVDYGGSLSPWIARPSRRT